MGRRIEQIDSFCAADEWGEVTIVLYHEFEDWASFSDSGSVLVSKFYKTVDGLDCNCREDDENFEIVAEGRTVKRFLGI